jgi:hypothetical protein
MAATLTDGAGQAKAGGRNCRNVALPKLHVFGNPAAAQGARLTQIKFRQSRIDTLKLH